MLFLFYLFSDIERNYSSMSRLKERKQKTTCLILRVEPVNSEWERLISWGNATSGKKFSFLTIIFNNLDQYILGL